MRKGFVMEETAKGIDTDRQDMCLVDVRANETVQAACERRRAETGYDGPVLVVQSIAKPRPVSVQALRWHPKTD